jgi:cell division septum initiation protein DivIVA
VHQERVDDDPRLSIQNLSSAGASTRARRYGRAVDTAPRSTTVDESPMTVAARMLEVAGLTAERLVSDAEAQAKSLIVSAQAEADAIQQASRTEASQVATDMARAKEQQADDLRRARDAALTDLNAEKAALDTRISELRQVESRFREHLRLHLSEQLSMLDNP